MDKENNFDNFKEDKITEITIPALINNKRVHFIARHLLQSSGHQHCAYVGFFKNDFPFFDYPKKLSGENNYKYNCSVLTEELNGHYYCSYYDESEVNGEVMTKIGWDYNHLYDDNYRSGNRIDFIVEHDLKDLYDSFFELSNKCKENKGE